MRIHNKQFVICSNPILIYEDWKSFSITETIILSYCPHLRISILKDKNGSDQILIGYPTLPATPDKTPQELISALEGEALEAETNHWGGRWALLSKKGIITDASTIQGFYFDTGKTLISSSPVLLNQISENRNSKQYTLSTNYYFNWFLTPLTRYLNTKKLLVSQKICFNEKSFSIEKKFLLLKTSTKYEEIFDQLERLLINEILYISKSFKVNVALSSGYDSRLIYSIAKSALHDQFRSYTQMIPNMTGSDYKIPGHISNVHLNIKRKNYSSSRLKLIDSHSGKHVLDSDRLYYCYGQWDNFTSQDACIRGSILELAGKSSAHLYKEVPPLTDSVFDSKIYLYSLGDFRNFQLDSLNEYFEWTCSTHPLEIESKKRFYWEQRVGGWLSYIEQSLDLLPCTSLHIGNSLECINLFISLPPDLMKIKSFHIDFMRKHTPDVLDFPFNTSSKPDRIKQIIRNYYYKVSDKIFKHKT